MSFDNFISVDLRFLRIVNFDQNDRPLTLIDRPVTREMLVSGTAMTS